MAFDPLKPNTSQTIGDAIVAANANDVALKALQDAHAADTTAHGLPALLSSQAEFVAHEIDPAAHGLDVTEATLAAVQAEVSAGRGTAISLATRLAKALASDGALLLSSLQSKWLDNGDTPTYIDATHFSVPSDRTKVYISGAHCRVTISGSYAYVPVASSMFATGVTTITVDPNYPLLTSGLSKVEIGLLSFDYAIQAAITTALASITSQQAQIAALSTSLRTNLVGNAGCVIAQRTAPSLTTSAQYGAVDRFAAWATGTAVSAGTIAQDAAAPIGRKAFALHVSGATITGAGVVLVRHRIEAKDARTLKNQTACFSLRVWHDVGASCNYTIVVRKPTTTADDFSAVTTIATGAAQAVASAANTLISLPAVTMGDCSDGIEIEVQAACGAVTTKNFWFTEWKAEEGQIVTQFEPRAYSDDYARCQRYYWEIGGLVANEQFADGMATSTTAAIAPVIFPVEMRVTPSFALSANADIACVTANASLVACTALTIANATRRSLQLAATVASGLVAGNAAILQANNTTAARLKFTAEL